ncbi:MAG: endolytic transglycosylase MltG [Collinsella sp.]
MMYVTGGEVTADDLQSDSPYNTYKHEGLPPTPICSPSLEALKATLEPTDSDDLYFYIHRTRSISRRPTKSTNSLGIDHEDF